MGSLKREINVGYNIEFPINMTNGTFQLQKQSG
ncbi:MAG: hypothetical protein ACI815_002261 [Psychroserpens sp.]|jgi:hypothetical protein